MKILQDKREQAPFSFDGKGYDGVVVLEATLQTGDYSLVGLNHRVAVERKSLPDLIGSISHGRDRFERELHRARGLDSFMVVVEAPFSSVTTGAYRSRMNPKAATQTIFSFMARFRVSFHFAQNREWAEYATYNFLRHYARHIRQEYEAVVA